MRRYLALAVAGFVLLAGCSGGGSDAPTAGSAGSGTSGSGSSSGATLAVATSPGVSTGSTLLPGGSSTASAIDRTQRSATDVHVATFEMTASGADVTLDGVGLTASGTADDAADVDAVRLVRDGNGNGAYDPGIDSPLARMGPYPANDGSHVVVGLGERIADGDTLSLLVLYDLAGTARPGQTFSVGIADAADVMVNASRSVSVQGTPTTAPGVTAFVRDHLLITELVIKPTEGEFFEIYNPTADPVALDDYHVTDGTDVGNDQWYYNIVTGGDYGGGQNTPHDFHARFPDATEIRPDQAITVAFSSDDFETTYGQAPDYELLQDGPSDGVIDLVEVDPGSIGSQAGFSNSEEVLVLYRWDGTSDLVEDVDYVPWVGNRNSVEKTGVTIDGPDADRQGSTYRDDQDRLMQDHVLEHWSGDAMRRVDLLEGAESTTGGNGITGHDETDENVSVTFDSMAAPSPGTP